MRDADIIKDKIDIVDLIGTYVDLKKSGQNFKGLCPFHQEKSPSFYVSSDRQIWHCFGACDEGGDAISFYMKAESASFPEALKELAKKTGVELNASFEHDKDWQQKNKLYEILHLASEYYTYVLLKHDIGADARAYAHNRGITPELIKTFGIGYAPDGWENVIPFLKKKGYHDGEIEKAGLSIKGSRGYYDRFRGRLMFRLRDHRGNIVGFSGRTLDASSKSAKYINSPETALYHKSRILYGLDVTQKAIAQKNAVIICEGEFDVLTSYKEGLSHIVAIKGTALTKEQLTILKRFTKNIIFALDMDIAGDRAAQRSIALAESMDFSSKVAQLTAGKDLDEALQSDHVATKKDIEHAVSVYDYVLSSAITRHGNDSADGKKHITSDVLPLYNDIQNPIIKDFYVKKISRTLQTSEEAIREQMRRLGSQHTRIVPRPQQSPAQKKPRQVRLEEHLLSLIVQSKRQSEYLQKLAETITIEELRVPAISRILLLLAGKKSIPEELSAVYNRAHLADIGPVVDDQTKFDQEFIDTCIHVKKGLLKDKLKTLASQLKDSEDDQELNTQFNKLSHELNKILTTKNS